MSGPDLGRSAEWHSAVSPACAEASAGRPICNRPSADKCPLSDLADTLQDAILRYGRVQLCATLAVLLCGLLVAGFAAALQAQTASGTVIQSFPIKEFFGVAHPNQIIDFDFAGSVDWTKVYMIGPDGNEVPYQVLRRPVHAIKLRP